MKTIRAQGFHFTQAAIASIGSDMQRSQTTDTTTIDGATRQCSSSHSRPPSDAWITNRSSPGAQVIAETRTPRTTSLPST